MTPAATRVSVVTSSAPTLLPAASSSCAHPRWSGHIGVEYRLLVGLSQAHVRHVAQGEAAHPVGAAADHLVGHLRLAHVEAETHGGALTGVHDPVGLAQVVLGTGNQLDPPAPNDLRHDAGGKLHHLRVGQTKLEARSAGTCLRRNTVGHRRNPDPCRRNRILASTGTRRNMIATKNPVTRRFWPVSTATNRGRLFCKPLIPIKQASPARVAQNTRL